MENTNLPKTYNPKDFESRLYSKWVEDGLFKSKPNPNKKPFTIMLPPPNITGQLHMGHALDHTRSEEHTSELQSRFDLVCRLLLEKKKKKNNNTRRFQMNNTQCHSRQSSTMETH